MPLSQKDCVNQRCDPLKYSSSGSLKQAQSPCRCKFHRVLGDLRREKQLGKTPHTLAQDCLLSKPWNWQWGKAYFEICLPKRLSLEFASYSIRAPVQKLENWHVCIRFLACQQLKYQEKGPCPAAEPTMAGQPSLKNPRLLAATGNFPWHQSLIFARVWTKTRGCFNLARCLNQTPSASVWAAFPSAQRAVPSRWNGHAVHSAAIFFRKTWIELIGKDFFSTGAIRGPETELETWMDEALPVRVKWKLLA